MKFVGIPGLGEPSFTITIDRQSFETLRAELLLPPCREIRAVVSVLPEDEDADAWYAAEVERMSERAPA